ncbi:YraN family protein [Candidatus Gracilibacteria bacterium]|nr:MAG: YraN family protein [Candidatus Gracilibacteria bacterium]
MQKTTKQKGDKGELIAIKYLKSKGYDILDTNFKFGRFGEVDIIAEKEEFIYFFEVKYRENKKFGEPEESITKNKLQKFRQTIEFYVLKNNLDFEKIKFEVITILKEEKSYKLKHYKNLEI